MTEGEKTVVYFADADMSDVILVVGEKEFHVHKLVLAIRSKYFKALFYSDFKEKDQKRIEIEADPVAFERLLEYIYNGCLSDTKFFQCKEISNDFWDAANGLWTAIDRFDCEYARGLFVKQLKASICPQVEARACRCKMPKPVYRCNGCVDRFIFAAKHDIQFPKCSSYSVIQWLRENNNLPPELEDMKKMYSIVELGR